MHWATEEHLRASGMDWTFLRDNLYLDFLPLLAGDDAVVRGPAGDGRLSAVAIADVADAAIAVLLDPDRHAGQAYRLTGPESFSLIEAVALITEVTGRELRFHDETVDEAYASRASYGAPDWEVDAWVSSYTALAAGEMDGVTDDVERLSGHPATSLRELLQRGLATSPVGR